MKPLFPVFCRPLGYGVMALGLFLPMLMVMLGRVTDHNLLFYKECAKILLMVGALLIIFALTRDESKETEAIRNGATRNAFFLTVIFLFLSMLYHVWQGALLHVDTSSFLIYLVMNIVCLEYGLNKRRVDKMFRK